MGIPGFLDVPHVPLLVLAAISSLALAIAAFGRRGVPGAGSLGAMMVAGAVWGVAYALELASGDPAARTFWGEAKYAGVVAIPYAWLVFALRFSGKDGRLSRRRLLLLGAVPLLTLVLALTNDAHHLVRAYAEPVGSGRAPEVAHGPWFWVHAVYSYSLLGAGTAALLSTLRGHTGPYRGQYAAVAVGALAPWAANALYVLGLSPLGDLDPTPFVFALTGAAFLLGLRRFELLELVPVAREAVVEGMQDGYVVADRRGRVVDLNRAASRALGVPIAEAHGAELASILPDLPVEEDGGRGRGGDEPRGGRSSELGAGDGRRERLYEVSTSSFEGKGAAWGSTVVLLRDVTERRRAEEALRESEERFRAAFEDAGIGMALVGPDGRHLRINRAFCEMTGYAQDELLGMTFRDITHPEDLAEDLGLGRGASEGWDRAFSMETRCVRKDGSPVWVHLTVSTLRGPRGEPLYSIAQAQDITGRKRVEGRLKRRALRDALTGLPNRKLLVDRLRQALERTRRGGGRKVAVLFVDLDGFKAVNDSLGHQAGNALLVAVSERLRGCLRPGDTLARFGGDEFVALVEEVRGPEEAALVAERIAEGLGKPFAVAGRELFAPASIGIALGDAKSKTPEDLLRDADAAMYRAKDEAAGYKVFDRGMHERAQDRLRLERDLGLAVERDEFVLHYQPIVELDGGGVWGFEALVRWDHPERGLLHPTRFVPTAEEGGLAVALDERVLEGACRQAKRWQEEHRRARPAVVCVNLSAKQLRRPDLARAVEGVLRRTGLEPGALRLDVTETACVGALEGGASALRRLRAAKVGVAIDDFGAGHSSLSCLKRLPADAVKIDGSFVGGLGEDVGDTAIVRTVIDLAHALGMGVVAEGVESRAQAALLKEMGCDLAQGFYFAEPMPADAISDLLAV